MADGISERHENVQYGLSNMLRMQIIANWWVERRVYFIQRTPASEPDRLGSISHAEAFLLGCWSTMNGLARRPKTRAR